MIVYRRHNLRMGDKELLKAVARFGAFRSNLPQGDIDEDFVAEYHSILRALEKETDEHLFDEFNIPASQLERQISSIVPAHRGKPRKVNYRDKRSCDRNFFLMRLDAAINYLNSLVPSKEKERIGF